MSETLATIRGSEGAMQELIDEATLASKSYYENAYVNIADGELNIISSLTGGTLLSYSTFTEGSFLSTIEVSDAVKEQTPDDEKPMVEALLDIDTFTTYFDLIKGGDGSPRFEFKGELEDRLATVLEMYGGLNAGVYLPASESKLQKNPLWLPNRFDDDDVWRSDEVELDTEIHTDVMNVQRIIEAVDADEISSVDNYPVVVDNGEFTLNVTDENSRNWIQGSLDEGAESVSGEDVANLYGKGFEPLFDVLSGDVRLNTANISGGAPLVVLKRKEDGVIRHVVGPSGSL